MQRTSSGYLCVFRSSCVRSYPDEPHFREGCRARTAAIHHVTVRLDPRSSFTTIFTTLGLLQLRWRRGVFSPTEERDLSPKPLIGRKGTFDRAWVPFCGSFPSIRPRTVEEDEEEKKKGCDCSFVGVKRISKRRWRAKRRRAASAHVHVLSWRPKPVPRPRTSGVPWPTGVSWLPDSPTPRNRRR